MRFPQRSAVMKRAGLAALAALSVGLGGLAAMFGEALPQESGSQILLGVGLVLAAGLPTAWRLRRHGLDAPGVCALATMVLIGLTSLAWLGEPIRPGPGLGREDIPVALVIIALGLVALGLGARLVGPAERASRLSPNLHDGPSLTALVILFAVSLTTVAGGFVLRVYGYISDPDAVDQMLSLTQVLSLVAGVGTLVVLATALMYFRTGDRRLRVALAAFVVIQVTVGFIAGSKVPAVLPVVLVILAYFVIRRRIPVVAAIVTVAVLFVVVIPTNQAYRDAVRNEQQAPVAAMRSALSTPLELNPAVAFQDARDYVATRFRSIDSVALIHEQTPSRYPFAGGEKYFLLPAIIAVPRAVWPDKPRLDDAAVFTHTYRQASDDIRSSTEITQMGDLFRNFGWPGVVVGMGAWGALLAFASAVYRRHRSPRLEFVYLYAVPVLFVRVEADLPALIAISARTLPLAAVIAWLLLPGRTTGPGYRRLLFPQRGPRVARPHPVM